MRGERESLEQKTDDDDANPVPIDVYTLTPQVLLEYDTVIQLKSEKVRVLSEFYSTLVICIRFVFFG